MAWASMNSSVSYDIIILYISAIFWTLGYDTIYGTQDMSDDEIIGLKSTSIKFKKNVKLFIFFSYSLTSILILYLFKGLLGINFFSFLLLLFFLSLIIQVFIFDSRNPVSCLKSFKVNNYSGLLLFLTILFLNY